VEAEKVTRNEDNMDKVCRNRNDDKCVTSGSGEWNIPLVDAHVHVLSEGRYTSMIESMRQSGCECMTLLSLFYPLGVDTKRVAEIFAGMQRGQTQNDMMLEYKRADPDRFYVFGALDYGFDEYERLLSADCGSLAERLGEQPLKLKAIGCDGIKLIESKPLLRRFYPWPLDGDVYAKFFANAEKKRMPIMWHVGDPASFWDATKEQPEFVEEGDMLYTRPGDPQLEDLQQEAIRVLERHPNLTVIFAHFFFIDDELGRARALLDDYPNMYLDTTQHWEMYVNFNAQREGAREFFMDFQDRIVFGSDNVFGNYRDGIWSDEFAARNHQFMKQYFSSDDTMPDDFPPLAMKGFAPPGTVIRGLDLPDNVLRKFYHANFERIAGKRPAPLPE